MWRRLGKFNNCAKEIKLCRKIKFNREILSRKVISDLNYEYMGNLKGVGKIYQSEKSWGLPGCVIRNT
jgi:hypothetical protein